MHRVVVAVALLAWAFLSVGAFAAAREPNAVRGDSRAATGDVAAATSEQRADPFPEREQVSVGELFSAMAGELDSVAASPAVWQDYQALLARHGLEHDAEIYRDYVRIKIVFEATRAGGWWGVQWRITDEEPRSDRIWSQWRAIDQASLGNGLPLVTASAECDELSALFAFVAHGLGLSKHSEVGLFWPTSNHTVAVWTLAAGTHGATRIVVPTSQIFLDTEQSLGTTAFDPHKQKTIFDYRRRDAGADLMLPAALVREFIRAIQNHGGRAQDELQRQRNQRESAQMRAAQ